VQSPIDWNAAATDAAARFAGNTGGQQTFSAPPQALPEPCRPRELDLETKRMMAERLPEPLDPDPVSASPTANCIVVGGYPKCVQKIGMPRRKSLLKRDRLEDRLAGRKAGSSVPSPDVCD
jgi:hypothetical protein